MKRYDQIFGIITYIRGLSANNYQSAVDIILNQYYKANGKIFEAPSPNGGDDKNDGWVVEDAIFYQIYSPYQFSSSFAQDIKDKFEADLSGLCEMVFEKNKWNGIISGFIFIVNTRDTSLPKDPDRFYDSCVEKLKTKYAKDFDYKVVSDDYLSDLLSELDEFVLEQIIVKLNISGLLEFNKTGIDDIVLFIDKVGQNINNLALENEKGTDYKRISTENKIIINQLDGRKDKIEKCMSKLGIVDAAVQHFNNDLNNIRIFEKVKNLFIHNYNELSKVYYGEKLYDEILSSVTASSELKIYNIPAELTMIYIFDRCDIFKKE